MSLLIGLGAAGCMPHGGSAPTATTQATSPPKINPVQPDTTLVSDLPADSAQKVMIASVNDNVSRVSQILRQRENAKVLAADIREQREARALSESEASKEPVAAIDPTAKAERVGTVDHPRQFVDPNAPTVQPIDVPAATHARRTAASEPEKNQVTTKPPANQVPEDAWANTGLSAAQVPENGDFGDAVPARRIQGSISAPLEVSRVSPAPGASPGTPNVTRSPGIDPLLALQEQYLSRVNDEPRNLAAQLELQLARLLRNEPVPSMADLNSLAGEDRELLAAVGDALSNFRSLVKNDPNPLGSEKARPFIEMADRIRARSDLNVQSVNLCNSVKAFGNYEPIVPMQFIAGSPGWSVFYCEVDGFLSQLNEKQIWESKLSLELRLYNEAGMQMWRVAPETVTDISRKRRRDFFIAKKIQLPSKLAPGPYMLKATIRDLQANRVAESTLQVSIVGK